MDALEEIHMGMCIYDLDEMPKDDEEEDEEQQPVHDETLAAVQQQGSLRSTPTLRDSAFLCLAVSSCP